MEPAPRAADVRERAAQLAAAGVTAVALTYVDNAGITRVKAVPVARLEAAVTWGVGMSPVFDVYCSDDSATASPSIGGPVGDLRLFPDLDRLTLLHAMPGWAWAPVDRFTQDGEGHPACQRRFATAMTEAAAAAGLELRMAFEVEWCVGRDGGGDGGGDGGDQGDGGDRGDGGVAFEPGCRGPAYGMTRVVELSRYLGAVLEALAAQGVAVDQLHPEYSPGQMELSVAPAPPTEAADRLVLVKETIRAVSVAHGLRASFAPVVVAGQVGNGGHVHTSVWSEGGNLVAGGDGPHGLTERGESVLATVLDHLPALCAVGSPSVTSYLRLVPQRWAGPWQCWGRENREAALRLVTSPQANFELKCVDLSANPYLVAGAVAALVTAGAAAGARLPAEVAVDPATLPAADQPPRLPQSLPEAVAALESDSVLAAAMAGPLLESYVAVRRAEVALAAGRPAEEVVAATRWLH